MRGHRSFLIDSAPGFGLVLVCISLLACGSDAAFFNASQKLTRENVASVVSDDERQTFELALSVDAAATKLYPLTNASVQFVPGHPGPLAWQVLIAAPDSVKLESQTLYPTKAEADAKAAEAQKAGKAVLVRPADSIASLSDRPSPLVPDMATWPTGNQIHWLFKELFTQAAKRVPDQASVEGFAEFAAEQAATAFLREQFGAASPVLGAYMSERRDERTFARLYADYRERFVNLYSQNPLPADHEATRLLLHKAWAADYQFNYANRFITNAHADFAKEPVALVELAAWNDPFPRWADWEKRLADKQGDFAALVKDVLKR